MSANLKIERQEPSFDLKPTVIPANKHPSIDFNAIREVVELSRRLADEDYHRHLAAVVDAENEEAKTIALESLIASVKAFRLTDAAYKSLISAESDFRGTTVSLLQGDYDAAVLQAKSSNDHLDIVADKLDRFGDYAPQSKFFGAALTAAAKVDKMLGRLEDDVSLKVQEFSLGLKAFAKRVTDFGTSVAKFPAKVADAVKTTGVAMTTAVVLVGAKFMSGFRGMVDAAKRMTIVGIGNSLTAIDAFDKKMSAKIDSAVDSYMDKVEKTDQKISRELNEIKASAWAIIKESADMVARVQHRVESAADSVAKHGAVAISFGADAASLGGGLLSKIKHDVTALGQDIATKYVDRLEKVEAERTTRRTPRP